MTLSFYAMFGLALSKIYIHQFSGGLWNYSLEQKIIYSVLMVSFPFIAHPISRYYLLRKARQTKYVNKKTQKIRSMLEPSDNFNE